MEINPTTYPISWFRDRKNERALVLKPPYQRKPVWTTKQKAFLIDTIIKKYHIPEIFIHRETNRSGSTIYNIVDGQQRIRSILDFLNGDFAISDEYMPDYADYSFDELPEEIKQAFWNYTLYIREITDASEDDVKILFRRMNINVVNLNAQELRHATYSGEFIVLMEDLAEDDFWAENKIVTTNEIRRMKDVEFISDLFVSIMHGIQDKTKDLDKYYAAYETEFPDKVKWRNHFLMTKEVIIKVLPQLRSHRWKNKSDFYTLFVLFAELLRDNEIPIANYKKLNKDLIAFSEKISFATKKENKGKKQTAAIAKYVNAVTKSTTDKDRRLLRHNTVKKVVSKYFKKTPKI